MPAVIGGHGQGHKVFDGRLFARREIRSGDPETWQVRWRCPCLGHQIEDGVEVQNVHQTEELVDHDALPTAFEIGQGSTGKAEPRGNVPLGEAELPAAVRDRATETAVEFHVCHNYKLPGRWACVKQARHFGLAVLGVRRGAIATRVAKGTCIPIRRYTLRVLYKHIYYYKFFSLTLVGFY